MFDSESEDEQLKRDHRVIMVETRSKLGRDFLTFCDQCGAKMSTSSTSSLIIGEASEADEPNPNQVEYTLCADCIGDLVCSLAEAEHFLRERSKNS